MDRLDYANVLRTAERVLTGDRPGRAALLAVIEPCTGGAASLVLRCRVTAAGTGSAGGDQPDTVIVKVAREMFGSDDPDDTSSNAAQHLFDDWAGCAFLNTWPPAAGLAPRFLGGDRPHGLVVLEDLGNENEGGSARATYRTTYDALLARDASAAREALIEHASRLGLLHASTVGGHDAYQSLRRSLGPTPMPNRPFAEPWVPARLAPFAPDVIAEAVRRYRVVFASVGILPLSDVDTEIADAVHAVEENPGPFLSLCQGDMDNAGQCYRDRQGMLRLLDFGAGGFRHALIEGMPGRMNWGCTRRIPRSVVAEMEQAYWREWRALRPETVADGAAVQRAMGQAAARCHVFHVLSRVTDALAADRKRGPLSTLRQQVLAWLGAFADLAGDIGQMPALGGSSRQLAERLRELWPPESHTLPYYPAFCDAPP